MNDFSVFRVQYLYLTFRLDFRRNACPGWPDLGLDRSYERFIRPIVLYFSFSCKWLSDLNYWKPILLKPINPNLSKKCFRNIFLKFESIEFSSGINFCDDVGAAVATMIDNINADIKQVTDNIPIVFTIAQLIANQ